MYLCIREISLINKIINRNIKPDVNMQNPELLGFEIELAVRDKKVLRNCKQNSEYLISVNFLFCLLIGCKTYASDFPLMETFSLGRLYYGKITRCQIW